MTGPEDNPRDDEPIDREEYERAMITPAATNALDELRELIGRWRENVAAQNCGCVECHAITQCAKEVEMTLAQHVLASEAAAPWLWGIAEPSGAWHDGEQCVFGDEQSAKDEVDMLNDNLEEGEPQYTLVPLYRTLASPSQQSATKCP